mgnify:CR=1 FL=1
MGVMGACSGRKRWLSATIMGVCMLGGAGAAFAWLRPDGTLSVPAEILLNAALGTVIGFMTLVAAVEVYAACIGGTDCCRPDSFCGENPCVTTPGISCNCCRINNVWVCCDPVPCPQCVPNPPCDIEDLEPCDEG